MNNTIKIAHIADCHLRAAQYGSRVRGQYFYLGLLNAIRKAYVEGVDLILCAGDLLDSNNPGPGVVMVELRDIDDLLKEYNIPMLVSKGNHDNVSPSWLYQFEKDGSEHILRPGICPAVQGNHVVYELSKGNNRPIRIEAYDFTDPETLKSIARFDRDSSQHPFADIMMWHGEIKEFCGYPKEEALGMADFPENAWKLVAMGDQHIHKYIKRASDGLVVAYPGSTEMCSESEDSDKKMLLYTWKSDGSSWYIHSIESVAFETQPVLRNTVSTQEDLESVLNTMRQADRNLIYLRYDKRIPDVVGRLTEVATEKNHVLRLTPMMPDRPDMNSISRESVVLGPSAFFNDHAEELIEDLETRNRIGNLCKDLLDPCTSHRDRLNKYCEDRINLITL